MKRLHPLAVIILKCTKRVVSMNKGSVDIRGSFVTMLTSNWSIINDLFVMWYMVIKKTHKYTTTAFPKYFHSLTAWNLEPVNTIIFLLSAKKGLPVFILITFMHQYFRKLFFLLIRQPFPGALFRLSNEILWVDVGGKTPRLDYTDMILVSKDFALPPINEWKRQR